MEITYGAPVGDDRQSVMREVLEYWKRRMRQDGNDIGFSEGCSTAFGDESGPEVIVDLVVDEDAVEPNENRYSDYEEHRLQMDAGPEQLRMLLAMMRARCSGSLRNCTNA